MTPQKVKRHRPFILETKRMYLNEIDAMDADDLFELNNDPTVMHYTSDQSFTSIENARLFCQSYSPYKSTGMGRWSMRLKTANQFIGGAVLNYIQIARLI